MAARYDFRKAPNPQGGDGVLYPRLVSNGTIPWETIVDEIAQDSSFDPGTIMGVMHEVEHRVLRHMSDGFRVQVGAMCYAEPTVETDRKVTDEDELHAQSVRFGKVLLQPSKKFRPQGRLERADAARKFGHSSTRLTPGERYARLEAYLREHGTISRARYCELTGLLRSTAQRELHRWIAEGKLRATGFAPHRVYQLAISD